jgi:Sugar (and other) transporter
MVVLGPGVCCLAAFVFIYFRVPETKGRSLEEIESTLRSNTFVGSDGETDTAEYEQDVQD